MAIASDLPAGRELDFAVHEIMTGERRPYAEHRAGSVPTDWELSCPRYSTDIGAAWTVVEKLDTDLWLIQVTRKTGMNERFLRWWVELRSLKDLARDPFEVAGDSAPLAICRAALKAVGHA